MKYVKISPFVNAGYLNVKFGKTYTHSVDRIFKKVNDNYALCQSYSLGRFESFCEFEEIVESLPISKDEIETAFQSVDFIVESHTDIYNGKDVDRHEIHFYQSTTNKIHKTIKVLFPKDNWYESKLYKNNKFFKMIGLV